MFDLTLAPTLERLGPELQKLAVDKLRPFAAAAERDSAVPDEVTSILRSWSWLPGSDAFESGTGAPQEFCTAAESLAWADPALALAWVTSRQVAWLISACGTDEQKAAYLPRLAASPVLPVSLLLFEGYGRSPSELETTARPSVDGWVVNGTKTAVFHSQHAELAVVVARDEAGGLMAFVVDDPSGIRYQGNDERWLAMGAASPATYGHLENLELPASAALRTEGLADAVGVCRLVQASALLGSAEAATRYAANWATERMAFGRPLVGFQGVAFVLANLLMEVESTKTARIDVLSQMASGSDTELLTSRLVAQANHLLRNGSREGIELMGVHGVITDHPQERVYRSAGLLASVDFDPLLSPLVLSNS